MSALSCRTPAFGRFAVRAFLGLAAALLLSAAWATDTDISKSPLFTTQAGGVKPNLLFVLDDSGSMDWEYMPDEVNDNLGTGSYGYKSYQCNGVQYDPSYVYTPPVYANGTSYPNASFGAAWTNGYDQSAGTTNLANKTYYRYTGTQPKMGWTFTATAPITTTTFYRECDSNVGSTPGSAVFTLVTMTSASTDAQNYANWYSYYRTRMLMMKTAVGMAFKPMDDKFRIGFTKIHSYSLPVLDVSTFDATQKGTFYTNLYAATPGNSTPLRGALSRAGQYYAKKAPGQTYDPVQYSCQRNFTLLSTDGYWNTRNENSSGASSNYGPYKLDNVTLVGQQDGGATPRPYYDGGQTNATNVYHWTQEVGASTTTATPMKQTTIPGPSSTDGTPISRNTQNHLTSYGNTATTSQLTISAMPRPSSTGTSTITVTTNNNHGYSTGDSVYFTGLPANWHPGPFTITRTSSTKFTFTDTFTTRPASNGDAATVQLIGSGQCPSGRAYVVTQPQQQYVYSNVTTSAQPATIVNYIANHEVTTYSTYTFTETVTLVNDVITSDNTTSTSVPSTTTPDSIRDYQSGQTTTTGTTTTTVPNSTGPWTNTGGSSTGTTCVLTSTLPSDANLVTGLAPTSTTHVATINTGDTSFTTTTGNATTTPGATYGTPSTKTLDVAASSSNTTGGSLNSLADIAMYYYSTDLRDSSLGNCTGALGTDVCSNIVGQSGDDTADWQHMATFTLGLGAGSSLVYDFNYQTNKSGDFYSIMQGSKTWPVAAADSPTAIDDLWHAGVNGRGRYFSVQNATDLSRSLTSALDAIRAVTGTASAAATSTLQPVQGDNDVFVAQFTTVEWVGEILKSTIDPSSGVISSSPSWSVQTALENKTAASRAIYYKAPGSNTLQAFNASNLSTDGYGANFTNFCTKTGAAGTGVPTQCSGLSSADLALANTADNLVNYLRGDKTATYYRPRTKVLGDIVNASPVFVGKPRNNFTENNYAGYVSSYSTREGVVYAAANDGMLHAFLQTTGEEIWAYIPTPMLPKLYKLADNNYSSFHDYFVDGTPAAADVFINGQWRTILVGGYKAGGSGYYALDVTDTRSPRVLWEFTDVNMGLSYGNPIITKRRDGTWVVVLTSGYNNTATGDGNGHLYVVNATTGTRLLDLPTYTSGTTPAGTTSAPNGLAMINSWVDFDTENLSKRFYGGDLLGNIWRFDIDSYVVPYGQGMLLAQLRDSAGNAQPVTTKPVVAEVTYNGTQYPIVYVVTGKYLGTTDLSTTAQQSSYAFIDPLTTTGYGNIRAANVLVAKTAGTNSVVDWAVKKGWMYDFLTSGERSNVDSTIAINTIYTATNVPSADLCTVGGSSYEYEFDLVTGNLVRTYMGASLIVGLTVVQLASDGANAGAVEVIFTRSSGQLESKPSTGSISRVQLRRTSWREIN